MMNLQNLTKKENNLNLDVQPLQNSLKLLQMFKSIGKILLQKKKRKTLTNLSWTKKSSEYLK